MKKKDSVAKTLIELILFVVVVEVLTGVGIKTGLYNDFSEIFSKDNLSWNTLVKLSIMIFIVFAVNRAFVLFLSLFKSRNARGATVNTILRSITSYTTALVLICWGLTILGVNVSTVATSVGIVALVVGFGAESLIEDVITGLFMLLENQYNVGDILEVDGYRGTVTNIGIRTTSLTDTGGNIKIINNSNMKDILNRSNNVSVSVVEISIPYETDIEKFELQIPGVCDRIYEKHADLLKAKPEYLGISKLGDSGINMKFKAQVDEANIYNGQRMLNRELLVEFKKLGVECPFPQLDVHNK